MKNKGNKVFLLCFFASCLNVLAGCQHLEKTSDNIDLTSSVNEPIINVLALYKTEKTEFINNYFKADANKVDYLPSSLNALETLKLDAIAGVDNAVDITSIDRIISDFILEANKINTYEESLLAAYNFKKDFASLFIQNFVRVNVQEEEIVEIAEATYEQLTEDVKELLKSEKEFLDTLRLKIEELKNSVFTIKFVSNEGTTVLEQEVQYGNLLTDIISPVKKGYSFEGWYIDEELTTRYNFEQAVTTDLELYAKWNINQYLLTLLDSDGTEIESLSYDYNSQVTIEAPVKDGKTFVGWYSSLEYVDEITSVKMPLNGTTLYARWIDGNAIVVDNNQSIQSAINKSEEDGIIFVKPGFYSEALTIDKPITLLGNNFNIDGNGTRLPETIISPANAKDFNYYFENINLNITSNNVKISGITFDGDNPSIANVWKNENQAQLDSLRTASDSANASSEYLKTMLNKDLQIDGGVAIYASSNETKKISNLTIENNIIKNYSQYGVMAHGGLSSKGGELSSNVLVQNNHFENIIGLPVFRNSNETITFGGHYGRAIEFSSGISGKISKNSISNSTMGISVYYHYTTEHKILISENYIVDTAAGIWVNTTRLGEEIALIKNEILLSDGYTKPIYVDEKSFLIAIAISSVEGTGKTLVSENVISNYRIGINVSGNQATAIINIQKNKFNKIDEYAIAVANYLFGYSLLGQKSNLNIHNDNIYNDSIDLNVDEFNAGVVQTINYLDNDEVVATNLYGSLAAPKLTLKNTRTEVSWAAIANATGYEVYINNERVATLDSSALLYTLPLEYDEMTIQIKALAGGVSENLTDSALSSPLQLVKYTKVETLYLSSSNITTTSTPLFALVGTKLSTLLVQTKSGYTYTGWNNEDSVVDLDLEISASMTFNTKWLKNYTVKYYDVDKTTLLYTETVAAGNVPELLELNVAWYTHKTLRTAAYLYSAKTVEANLILYAEAI